MVKAFRDLRLLRQNLKQVHATYEKLSALLVAERQNIRDEDGTKIEHPPLQVLENKKDIEEISKKLKEAESREAKLIKQEAELRRMLRTLESTVDALNGEITKMKSKTGEDKDQSESHHKGKESPEHETEEDSELDDDEDTANSEFSWSRFADLLQQLKDSTKLDQVVESYLDIFKDLKIPEINISKLWLDQLPSSLEEIAKNLKQGLDEKVHEVEQTLYATNWDEYVQKAKDVTSRVGETVGTLWQKAKDLSDHVREQHGEQGEKIFNDIKSTVEKAAEIFDQRWEQATRFWKDVVGSREEDEFDEEANDDVFGAAEEDTEKDQVWIHHESTVEDASEDVEEAKEEETKEYGTADEQDSAAPEFNSAKFAAEVKQLREALKSSSVFSRYVTDEFADHYFRRLKQASRSLSDDTNDYSAWWMCQKLWWTHHSFAYGRQCSDKLMSWQRHVRVDLDVRQKLIDQTPDLKTLIKKFASEDTQKIQDGANWVFEWAKNRQEMRQEDERRKKTEKNSWLYERWRSRDEMRHQELSPPDGPKWLFRRGKERERKREEPQGENWHRRRARGANQGAKETSKKQNVPNSQKYRR